MRKCTHIVKSLPDMEMYGGDTTPWEISIILPEQASAAFADLSGFRCEFSILPYRAAVSQPLYAPAYKSPLTKTTSISMSSTATEAIAFFDFEIADTINLYGKYIYQVAITNGDKMFISQGYLLIKPNVNRG